MVFPKINHGFLSADQQLIKRRLIKVVLPLAGVQEFFFAFIIALGTIALLFTSFEGVGGGLAWEWGGSLICKYLRTNFYLMSCI